jgi:hypothetical protein
MAPDQGLLRAPGLSHVGVNEMLRERVAGKIETASSG